MMLINYYGNYTTSKFAFQWLFISGVRVRYEKASNKRSITIIINNLQNLIYTNLKVFSQCLYLNELEETILKHGIYLKFIKMDALKTSTTTINNPDIRHCNYFVSFLIHGQQFKRVTVRESFIFFQF